MVSCPGHYQARVYSSQWCRCIETAQQISLGDVTELPALNSFYERPQDREPNLAVLGTFLSKQPSEGKLILLITHFVTIAGITGTTVASGEGVVMRLKANGSWKVLDPIVFH